MMYKLTVTNQFRKDFKKVYKSGIFNLKSYHKILNILLSGEEPELKYKDHSLKGHLNGYRECHICPDLLLIYRKYDKVMELHLFRIGNHSELF